MSAIAAILHAWAGAAERLALRLPELAAAVTRGSWPAAVVVLVLGAALLVAGCRLGRVLAAAASAGVGWLAGARFFPNFELWNLPPATPSWVGALVLGVTALGAPELYPLVVGGVPGFLLGMHVSVAGRSWLGGAVGAVALALLALWLRRLVLAATAACAGAALVVAALATLAARVDRLAPLAQRPLVLAVAAAVLAIAGTGYQLGTTRRLRPTWDRGGQPLRS